MIGSVGVIGLGLAEKEYKAQPTVSRFLLDITAGWCHS
jgi:hypothetical protein